MLQSMGSKRVGHHGATEQQKTTASIPDFPVHLSLCRPHLPDAPQLSLSVQRTKHELSWKGVDWHAAFCSHWSITDLMDMNLSKLWEIVKDREAWYAAVHGVTKSWT